MAYISVKYGPYKSNRLMSSLSYNDKSQITSLTIVYSSVYSGADQRKLRVTGLCEGNSPVTGEFPAQRPVTRKIFPFDDVIMHRDT